MQKPLPAIRQQRHPIFPNFDPLSQMCGGNIRLFYGIVNLARRVAIGERFL